jgi:uncharacterized repeat protein (TIGR02059 family)
VSSGTNTTISGNNISYSGMISGMGGSGDGGYCGVACEGTSTLITLNNITYSGYDGIRWGGQGSEISYNFINWSCMNKADGAGAYTYRGTTTGKVIKYNIIMNSQAQPYGWAEYDNTSANGIYFDGASDINCHHNVLAYNQGKGIFVNADHNITCEYNTGYGNKYDIYIFSENTGIGLARGHVIRYNTLVSKKTDDFSLCVITKLAESDLPQFGVINYNTYAKPINLSGGYIFREYGAWGGPNQTISKATFYSQLGYEANGIESPVTVTDTSKIHLVYNATTANKLISLDAGYLDIMGTKYSGSITLLPYAGVVLIVDPNPSAPSASPAYVSSTIENATPSLLEMTYNMTLASVVPAASSFSVLVNSAARSVSAVVISGTKVQLALSTRILPGDVVTVSYIKPANNPLETNSGGIASSITAQPVNNNCINVAPTAVITSPAINSSFTSPANISITANAIDNDGSVSLVEFYNGNTKLGSSSASPYSFTWNNVTAGNYSLTIIATDNLSAKTTSSAISISVISNISAPNMPPVVKILNPHKGNAYANLSSVEIDATASDPDGTISKVEFYNGKVKLVELTSAPYTYIWKDVAAGNYSITAVATDNLNDTTLSSPVEFVVGAITKYDGNSDVVKLFPNPNNGHFSIEFINPLQSEKSLNPYLC